MTTGDKVIDHCALAFVVLIMIASFALLCLHYAGVING